MSGGEGPGLYGELAGWFHLLTPPEEGLCSRDEWLGALRDTGFQRTEVAPGSEGAEVFLAWR